MPASVLTKVPADSSLPPERLATLGKFAVPYGGLHDIGVGPGDTLIVVGASGNFGSAAVLLGVALGWLGSSRPAATRAQSMRS